MIIYGRGRRYRSFFGLIGVHRAIPSDREKGAIL